jgi:hypothetical protein
MHELKVPLRAVEDSNSFSRLLFPNRFLPADRELQSCTASWLTACCEPMDSEKLHAESADYQCT